MRCRGFTLIELLVVIAIIAVLMAVLLPALASARNTARLAVSLSNVKQIATAHELYRVDRKDALPVPFVFANSNPNFGYGSVNLFGGKFCNSAWDGSGYDYWPGERSLNEYSDPTRALPRPTDVAPSWQPLQPRPTPPAGEREAFELPVWRSPGDKRARVFGPTPPDTTISQYECSGSSYIPNIYWVESACFVFTGTIVNSAGSYRAIRWGTSNYNRLNTAKFVIVADTTASGVRNAFPINSVIPVIKGEFGGGNKSVMGFADGHSAYVEMKRMPFGTFPFSEYGLGSLAHPDFDYSFQMDLPTPR
ncbi:MAG TPA: type II secretion system protein [Phycisphaerales bacterium]|nr:type II secretion system protein [Phycisphaerales bacterium]